MTSYDVDVDGLRDLLAGRNLNQIGDSLLEAGVKMPFTAGPVRFASDARLSVRVLNRPDDRDEDGVYGRNAHLAFDLDSAWVKYKLTTHHDGRVTLGGLTGRAAHAVELSDYRLHAATDDAWQSLRRGLSEPRTLLDIEDVKKLAPGEALALEIGGTLTTSLALAWSDAIADSLRSLIHGLPHAEVLAVKLSAGLDTTLAVKVEDQFSLVVSRTIDGRFRVAIHKARSRNRTASIEVAVGGEISAIPAIEEALAPLFEAMTGVALEKAERLANRLGIGQLTSEETELVDRLARLFGLGTTEERGQRVRKAIAELRRELRERLADAARWKAAVSFGAEYASIEENDSIADYAIDDVAELERDHALLLAGDFATITTTLRDRAGTRTLIRYLNETTLTRRRSSGFSLGIGPWPRVEAKDDSLLRLTTRTSIDGYRLLNYRGTQRYHERLIPQNDFEWIVDLRATMKEFVERPVTLDFDYSLRYFVTLERNLLTGDDLVRMLDFAAMWDIRTPDESVFSTAVGRKGVIRVQFRFDGADLADTLGARERSGDWTTSLAAAMPYASVFPERRSVEQRIATYRDVWDAWLDDPAADTSSILSARINSGLRLLEEPNLPGSFGWTVTTGHPQMRRRLEAFIRGAETLRAALTEPHPHETIASAYSALRQFWSQRLYVAASGHWLLAHAARAGVDVNRSIQIDLGDTTLTA
jgi:hypothetical protein